MPNRAHEKRPRNPTHGVTMRVLKQTNITVFVQVHGVDRHHVLRQIEIALESSLLTLAEEANAE